MSAPGDSRQHYIPRMEWAANSTEIILEQLDRKQQVATKAAVQFLGHFLKVAYFGHLLLGGGERISPTAVAVAIPLAIAGTHLSRLVLDLISEAQFRTWSRYVIGAVSTIYLIQGVVLL